MKKFMFMAASAALALASCSSEEEIAQVQGTSEVNDGAVMFSAYTGRNTRASVITETELAGLGFGVYAFEQNTTPWNTYRASNTVPNFFYNQKVMCDVSTWDAKDGLTFAQKEAIVNAALKALYSETTPMAYTPSAPATITKTQYDALTSESLSASTYAPTVATYTLKSSIDDVTYGAAPDGTPFDLKGLYTHNGTDDNTTTATITKAQCDELSAAGITVANYVGDPATYNLAASINKNQYDDLSAVTEVQTKFTLTEPGVWDATGTLTKVQYEALSDAEKALCTPATFTADSWDYEPHKYFSNNEGALHSFFAYAPYQKNVTTVFSKAISDPAVRYNASDDYDLLWGEEGTSGHANVDKTKKAVTGPTSKIAFNFKHALSKVKFDVTYFNDDVHSGSTTHTTGGGADDFLDNNTTITVRSVKFVGNVPSQGLLNLYDGSWTYETTEESAYEVVPATPFTFTWDGTDDAAMTPKTLKENMMVIPTMSTDNVKIQVVYDVTTVDPADPKNNSTVTNTITSEDSYPLAKGTAYTFHLHLGITSVKFDADVTGWGGENYTDVDLPNNF